MGSSTCRIRRQHFFNCEALLESEGMWSRAVCFQIRQLFLCFVRCGMMPCRNPPQCQIHTLKLLKPLAAAAEKIHMVAAIGEIVERVDVLPHGHIEQNALVLKFTEPG